ncbi:adenosylcobinamide amidohydrolase [Salipiger manganoxidans]|nr:adenosylcobinamide amidohydrolase [Salipiger manganoxidans]MEB3417761.1 adenosylcobinamide amidohydrolase [Salipiger manganoxidans]
MGAELRVLSWALNRPGYVRARRILWREVRNADLPPDLDVRAWLAAELDALGAADAVVLLTSRDVTSHRSAAVPGAFCLATVGLSNAERVGHRVPRDPSRWGTINLALQLDAPLSDTGLLEALSIATEARTAAVMDLGLRLPGGIATGTGTDCIAVAAPEGGQDYAGLHTDIGEAIGAAVYAAVTAGGQDWMRDVAPRFTPPPA